MFETGPMQLHGEIEWHIDACNFKIHVWNYSKFWLVIILATVLTCVSQPELCRLGLRILLTSPPYPQILTKETTYLHVMPFCSLYIGEEVFVCVNQGLE